MSKTRLKKLGRVFPSYFSLLMQARISSASPSRSTREVFGATFIGGR